MQVTKVVDADTHLAVRATATSGYLLAGIGAGPSEYVPPNRHPTSVPRHQRGHSAGLHEPAPPRNTRIPAGRGCAAAQPSGVHGTYRWLQGVLGDSHGDSALPARDRWKRHHHRTG